MRLEKNEFKALFEETYKQRLLSERIDELFDLLDEERKESVSLESFYNLVDLIENNKNLAKPEVIDMKCWKRVRKGINRCFKFDKIVESTIFQNFMLLVVMVNTVVILMYTFSTDDDLLNTLDELDNILVYIYTAEIFIKILGMGITGYFKDTWNVSDFILTIISIGTNIALSFTRVAKATRLVRGLRANRAIKLCKVVRGIKLFRFCMKWIRNFNRIELLFRNIAICFPIVLKLTIILFMVSYFYSIIGMEVYNSTRMVHATSEYVEEYYASFDDIGGALLILMAVINQNGWGALQYDFAVRFDSLASSATFFGTFNAISNMIIISLLTGLIWEVFAFTSKSLAEQLKIDEVLEELSVYDRLLSSKTRGSDDKTPANDDDKPKESKSLDLDNIHKRARSHSEKRHGIPSFTRIDVQKYVNKKSGVKLDNSDHSIEKNGEQHHSFSVVVEDDEEYKAEIPKFKVSKARKNNPAEPDSVKTIDVLPDENAEIAKVNNLPNSTGSVYLTNSQPQVNGIVKMADSSSYNSLKDKALDPNQPTSHVGDYEGAKLTSHDSEEAENKVVELFKKTNKKWNKQATEGNLFKFLNQEKKEMEIPDIDYNDDSFFSDKYSKVLNKINYHKLEKKFFVKKINILNCFTHEKNQMDHMMQIIPGQTLDKFASEVAYLRIEDHEEAQQPPEGEENDDELDMMEIGEIIQLATIGQVSQKKFKEIKDKIHEKILKKKRKMEFYAPTVDRIIRKALMQGADIHSIKKYEEGYLSNLYGTWFHKIKAKSPEFLMTNFETENRCLIRLMRLMKQPDIMAKDFVEIIHMIETSINANLLEKGSVAKFLFKDSQERWFFTYKWEGVIKIHYLKYGPWGHFEDVFPETDKLYESKDIMFPGANGSFHEIVKNFHVSLSRMAKVIFKNRFREFSRKETIWNMYSLPFETENTRTLRGKVLKSIHRFSSTDMKNVESLLVTQGVLVSVNYLARANKVRAPESAAPSPAKRMHMAMPYAYGTDDILLQPLAAADESISTLRRSNSSESLRQYKPVLPTHKRARIKTRYFVGRDHSLIHDEERMADMKSKQNSVEAAVPLQEYLDFLRDIRDILNQHKEYFLTKMNVFYVGNAQLKST